MRMDLVDTWTPVERLYGRSRLTSYYLTEAGQPCPRGEGVVLGRDFSSFLFSWADGTFICLRVYLMTPVQSFRPTVDQLQSSQLYPAVMVSAPELC